MKFLALIVLWLGVIGFALAEDQAQQPVSGLPGKAPQLTWRASPAETKALSIEDSGPGFVTWIQALAFCGLVAFGGVYLTRRYGKQSGNASARRLRLIERTALSSKTSLVLVELDGRPFLVSLGQERASITPVDDFQSLAVSEEGEECKKVIGFPA